KATAIRHRAGDAARQPRGLRDRAPQDQIATLDVRRDVRTADALHEGDQVLHRENVAAADIDAPEQDDPGLHRLSPGSHGCAQLAGTVLADGALVSPR